MSMRDEIAGHYRQAIRRGRYKAGEPMPPVRQVATDRKCSINVATDAYKLLKMEGLIITRPGSGTIVAPNVAVAVMSGAQSADRRMAGCGNQGPGESLDGHRAWVWACDRADIAALLRIQVGDDVVVRQRQRRDSDGRVNWHNTGYTLYRITTDVPEILDPTPLHGRWPDMYRERTGKQVTRGPQQYAARMATPAELDCLGIDMPPGGVVPVLVKRVVWSDPDGPVDVWEDVMYPGLWDQERLAG